MVLVEPLSPAQRTDATQLHSPTFDLWLVILCVQKIAVMISCDTAIPLRN